MAKRDPAIDAVRGLALLSMFVAHVAPTGGPGEVLALSEYLTMPLFALLVGVGAELGARRVLTPGGPPAGRRRLLVSLGVRALVLIVLGYALTRLGSQVVIVLVHLGALLPLAAVLARLSSRVLLVLLPLLTVVAAWAVGWSRQVFALDITEHNPLGRFVWFTLGGTPYRLSTMVAYAVAGVLIVRWLYAERPPRPVAAGAAGVAGLAVTAGLLIAHRLDRLTVLAYSGSLVETVLNLALAGGVTLLGWALARTLPALANALAALGAMTLTLYVAQILWLALFARRHPGVADDSWTNLAVLVLGSAALAGAWRAVVRRPPWQRGPLEGAEAWVIARGSDVRHV